MSHPCVSIIVPVYNCDKYLNKTLLALKKQTLKNIEILLIDDGSKDHSSVICDIFAAETSNVYVLHKKNEGVSTARNVGMNLASGEYLLFCDADDIPDSKWAEELYLKATKETADICFCGFNKEASGNIIEDIFPYTETITDQDVITKKLIMPMCVWGYPCEYGVYGSVCRGAYRREFINKVAVRFSSNICLGEDLLFNIELLLHTPKIAFVEKCLYTYMENDHSLTHTGHEQLWEKYKLLWNTIHMTLKDQISDNDTKWHNFQLSKYAVNYIVEGICPRLESYYNKYKAVNNLLNERDLQKALLMLPNNLPQKDSFLCWIMRMHLSPILLGYYQARC